MATGLSVPEMTIDMSLNTKQAVVTQTNSSKETQRQVTIQTKGSASDCLEMDLARMMTGMESLSSSRDLGVTGYGFKNIPTKKKLVSAVTSYHKPVPMR